MRDLLHEFLAALVGATLGIMSAKYMIGLNKPTVIQYEEHISNKNSVFKTY